jgi:ATP-dependent protease HslVU (ClpYQ) ATPase subunit
LTSPKNKITTFISQEDKKKKNLENVEDWLSGRQKKLGKKTVEKRKEKKTQKKKYRRQIKRETLDDVCIYIFIYLFIFSLFVTCLRVGKEFMRFRMKAVLSHCSRKWWENLSG